MSTRPEILELIHAELDGVASPSQQAALREAIARDPATNDEYRRLKGLCELLASVAPEQPRADLASSVMRRVRAGRTSTEGGIVSRIRQAWPGGQVAIRYAYAVAAGMVLGVLGLHFASGGSLFGSGVPEREATATLMPAVNASRLDLAPAGVRGIATLRPSTSGASIGLDLSAGEPVELVLKFDPAKDGGRVEIAVVRTGAAVPAGSLDLSRKD